MITDEKWNSGLTSPVYVIIAFFHLGFHIFDIHSPIVQEETYFSSENKENNTEVVLTLSISDEITLGNFEK